MLTLLAVRMREEVESHCHGASLASKEVALLLQRLSLLETVLLDHGVAAEHAELLRADAIHKLFRAWVAEQKGNVSTVGARALSHETWQPLAETQREASSLVDLFQCLSQTVDVFLSIVQPSSEMASHFERLLNMVVAAIFEYTSEVLRQCGSYEDVLAVVANWSYSGGGGGGGGIGGIGGSSFSSSAHKPRAGSAEHRMRELQSAPVLCTMLNTIYAARAKLASLWEEVERGWNRAMGASGGLREIAPLDRASDVLDEHAHSVAMYIGARMVLLELRYDFLDGLYLRGVTNPPQQIHALLPLIADKCAELVRLVDPPQSQDVAAAVLRAALVALERVLLDQPHRAYSAADAEALAEDLQALCDLFSLNLNNCLGCALPFDAVEASAARVRSLIGLLARPVGELVALYQTLAGDGTSGTSTSTSGPRSPMTPVVADGGGGSSGGGGSGGSGGGTRGTRGGCRRRRRSSRRARRARCVAAGSGSAASVASTNPFDDDTPMSSGAASSAFATNPFDDDDHPSSASYSSTPASGSFQTANPFDAPNPFGDASAAAEGESAAAASATSVGGGYSANESLPPPEQSAADVLRVLARRAEREAKEFVKRQTQELAQHVAQPGRRNSLQPGAAAAGAAAGSPKKSGGGASGLLNPGGGVVRKMTEKRT